MRSLRQLLTMTVRTALTTEGIEQPVLVSVLLVEKEEIRRINNEYRKKDCVTDVLSFPMLEMKDGRLPADPGPADMEDGRLFLGDIVVCVPKALEQAEAYGHKVEREMAFLTVHGLLHLLGYDHDRPEREATMVMKQEDILSRAGLKRISPYSGENDEK